MSLFARFRAPAPGFSIIEALFAMGLMGGLALVTTSLVKNGVMGQKTVEAQDDARTLTDDIARLLSDPAACAGTFGGMDVAAGAAVTLVKDKDGITRYQVTTPATKYGNRGISLTGLEMGGPGTDPKSNLLKWQPDSGGTTGTAFVQVNWLQTGNTGNRGTGPKNLLRYFLINVTGMSGNTITSCTAQGPGATSAGTGVVNTLAKWQTTIALTGSNVYEDSTGNIGIGSAQPQATLDVNGGIRPSNSALASLAAACGVEGVFSYDYAKHIPVFCNGTAWTRVGYSTCTPRTAQQTTGYHSSAVATCNTDETVIGGNGSCSSGNEALFTLSNAKQGNGWWVDCWYPMGGFGGYNGYVSSTAIATAFCCK